MCQSEQINELSTALNKAQSQMMCAGKDGNNPFFKSKYATLNSVWEAVKDALLSNGLSALQPISYKEGNPVVKTVIMHTSGQFITGECPIICAKQNDPQALGSAITYARRYSLASILGVMTDEDDDGEQAMARSASKKTQTPAKEPAKKSVSLDDKFNKTLAFLKSSPNLNPEKDEKQISFISTLIEDLKKAGQADKAKELNDLIDAKLEDTNA